MAAAKKSGWSTTRKVSQDTVYTHNWAIEDFDFAMGVVADWKIESGIFCIPGVPWGVSSAGRKEVGKFSPHWWNLQPDANTSEGQ